MQYVTILALKPTISILRIVLYKQDKMINNEHICRQLLRGKLL